MPNTRHYPYRSAGVIQVSAPARVVAARLHSPRHQLTSPGTAWDTLTLTAPGSELRRAEERFGGTLIEALPALTPLNRDDFSSLVFVIEDEKAIRQLVQDTLEGEGYRVGSARSAEDALTMLDQVSPSLILLDVRLPGMDGFAFVEAYRAGKNGVNIPPIILMSALRPRDELPEGVVGYLRKPFDLDDLLSHVGRAIAAY